VRGITGTYCASGVSLKCSSVHNASPAIVARGDQDETRRDIVSHARNVGTFRKESKKTLRADLSSSKLGIKFKNETFENEVCRRIYRDLFYMEKIEGEGARQKDFSKEPSSSEDNEVDVIRR